MRRVADYLCSLANTMASGIPAEEGALWRRSFSFSLGEFVALGVWVAISPYIHSVRPNAGKGNSWEWALLFISIVSLLGALGFRVGLIAFDDSRRMRWEKHRFRLAFTFGTIFPLSFFALRPLFGTIGAGIFPGVIWTFVGSVLAALLYRRLVATREPRLPR